MAYKPSLLEDRLKYIDNGLNFIDHASRDSNQIYVNYLKISNGEPYVVIKIFGANQNL